MPKKALKPLLFALLVALILAGCGQQKSGPVQAVENYLQALVAKDSDALTTNSCADWEDDAKFEMEAFAGVTAKLDGLACQEAGTSGDYTLVTCQGKIIATYNGEDQELTLDRFTYQAIEEGDSWRMCGYQK